MQTQWRRGSIGERTGLDYIAVETVARLQGFDLTPELFELVQAMEMETLQVDREQRERDAD